MNKSESQKIILALLTIGVSMTLLYIEAISFMTALFSISFIAFALHRSSVMESEVKNLIFISLATAAILFYSGPISFLCIVLAWLLLYLELCKEKEIESFFTISVAFVLCQPEVLPYEEANVFFWWVAMFLLCTHWPLSISKTLLDNKNKLEVFATSLFFMGILKLDILNYESVSFAILALILVSYSSGFKYLVKLGLGLLLIVSFEVYADLILLSFPLLSLGSISFVPLAIFSAIFLPKINTFNFADFNTYKLFLSLILTALTFKGLFLKKSYKTFNVLLASLSLAPIVYFSITDKIIWVLPDGFWLSHGLIVFIAILALLSSFLHYKKIGVAFKEALATKKVVFKLRKKQVAKSQPIQEKYEWHLVKRDVYKNSKEALEENKKAISTLLVAIIMGVLILTWSL